MKISVSWKGLLAGSVLLWLLAVLLHYAWFVHAAREYTRDFILPQLARTHYPLQLQDLSSRQLEILLKVEDPDFFNHGGVDFTTPGAGLTTITQALVKQLYFKPFRRGLAKIRQSLLAAWVLDPMLPKRQQLELFINSVYLDEKVRGLAAGAQAWFGKPFTRLNEAEYTALVAMIIAPKTFHVAEQPRRNKQRVRRILALVDGHYQPQGLMDLYYGKLDEATQQQVPALSYVGRYYE
ncbi:MAG: biosynthetic peptidoglycan transglycosylase [Thiolinea sp.]